MLKCRGLIDCDPANFKRCFEAAVFVDFSATRPSHTYIRDAKVEDDNGSEQSEVIEMLLKITTWDPFEQKPTTILALITGSA
jgi:hypothetical protein